MNVWHTYLFVPGNNIDRIGKAISSSADAVIIDLEDSVAKNEKVNARERVKEYFEHNKFSTRKIYVRVNDLKSDFWENDLEMVAKFPFVGVMLPKAETSEDIIELSQRLIDRQEIIPLIETAKGVLNAYHIAASPNVIRLAFGAVDYCLDLGISLTPNEVELIYPRSSLVVASKAAGIAGPIDTVFVDIHNNAGLDRETNLAIQLGLSAKLCIHPRQVERVNHLFLPSENEIKVAKEIVDAFERAERNGEAAIKLNGKMIDYPVYKQALSLMDKVK